MTRPSDLAHDDRELLLDLAEVAVRACLRGTRYPGPDTSRLTGRLREPCSAFVVVRVGADVFGCAGELAGAPLGACVPELALRAAFEVHDDRSITADDLAHLVIEISLVESSRPVPATTRAAVVRALDHSTEGISISAGDHHAILLPSVWKKRPDPNDFLDTVMVRAGLDPAEWPDTMTVELLTTTDFSRLLP